MDVKQLIFYNESVKLIQLNEKNSNVDQEILLAYSIQCKVQAQIE